MILRGAIHLCETGSLKKISLPEERSDWESTWRRQPRQAYLLGATDGGKEARAIIDRLVSSLYQIAVCGSTCTVVC